MKFYWEQVLPVVLRFSCLAHMLLVGVVLSYLLIPLFPLLPAL